MRPVVISPTVQEFEGVRYYKCGPYFQRKGVRLHRVVYARAHGAVPEGFHVHHIDGDRANNGSDNLMAIDEVQHLGCEHGAASGQRGRKSIAKAHTAAVEWHGSEAGRQWHAEHYEQRIRSIMERRIAAICQQCGGSYLVSAVQARHGKYCSGACKARALRRRRATERARRRVLSDRA